MSPMSTEPPVSAAMTGGPPTKFAQFTVYWAPLSASVAAKIDWYSFSWSPNVMDTPAKEAVWPLGLRRTGCDAGGGRRAESEPGHQPGGAGAAEATGGDVKEGAVRGGAGV